MNLTPHYHPFSKFMHWLMAAIWIFAWLSGYLAVHLRDQVNPDHILTYWHKGVAISLIFLIVVRVLWRLTMSPPPFPNTMSHSMRRAAFAGHFGLYLLALIALPVSGWALSSVANKPIVMFGLVEIPLFLAPNKDVVETVRAIHTYLSWFCGALVLGHILMVLKHHFSDRDGVLIGMMPRRRG